MDLQACSWGVNPRIYLYLAFSGVLTEGYSLQDEEQIETYSMSSLSSQQVYGKWGSLGGELLQNCQNLISVCAKGLQIILSFGFERKGKNLWEELGR